MREEGGFGVREVTDVGGSEAFGGVILPHCGAPLSPGRHCVRRMGGIHEERSTIAGLHL